MKYYYHPASHNCRKVTAALALMDLEVERELVDLQAGAQREESFLAINPNGMVPAIIDGDVAIWESNAILEHLAAATGTLLPAGEAAQARSWLSWQAAHFGAASDIFTVENVLVPMRGGRPDAARLERAASDWARFAAMLDRHLGEREFVLSALSIVDLALGASLTYAGPAHLPLDEYPHIRAWSARLDDLPAWRDSAPQF